MAGTGGTGPSVSNGGGGGIRRGWEEGRGRNGEIDGDIKGTKYMEYKETT